MKELRLLPAAVLAWLVVLSVILTRQLWVGAVVIVSAAVVAAVMRQWGQVVTLAAVGMSTGLMAWGRVQIAERFIFPEQITGRVESVRRLGEERSLIRLAVEGYPTQVPVLVQGSQEVPRSAQVLIEGRVSESDRPGLGEVIINVREVQVLHEAGGYAGWVNRVRDSFADSVVRHVGESSQGLIPGMVLGDTRLQDAAEEQTYIDTGLSHLSAVSGANVYIRGVRT